MNCFVNFDYFCTSENFRLSTKIQLYYLFENNLDMKSHIFSNTKLNFAINLPKTNEIFNWLKTIKKKKKE